MTVLRLRFETVAPNLLHKYSNEDPMFYSGTTQIVPNSQIPDEDWSVVERTATIDEDVRQMKEQYKTLKEWSDEDRDFVRNPMLEELVADPTWKRIEP